MQAGEGCGLAVGAVHAVALGLGSQDHELEVRHRVRNAVQGEGYRAGAEGDGSGCRGSDAGEGRRPCAFPCGIVLALGAAHSLDARRGALATWNGIPGLRPAGAFLLSCLMQASLQRPDNKKAPQLRCDAILGCGE